MLAILDTSPCDWKESWEVNAKPEAEVDKDTKGQFSRK